MTPKEIELIQEMLKVAMFDPNHTGIKQLQVESPIGDACPDVIMFHPTKAYNLGWGRPEDDGELLLYEHLKKNINVLVDAGSRDDTYFLSDPTIQYHLFEPDSSNYKSLESNLKTIDKDIFKNVYANNVGLGSENDKKYFYDGADGNGTFCPPVQPDTTDAASDVSYDIVRLDTYAKENKINNIDFLKIDVEGYELEVLKGAGDLLNNTKYVQFEYANTFHKAGITLLEVCQYLHKFGLTHFYVVCSNGLITLDSFHDHWMMMNVLAARENDELVEITNIRTLNPRYT